MDTSITEFHLGYCINKYLAYLETRIMHEPRIDNHSIFIHIISLSEEKTSFEIIIIYDKSIHLEVLENDVIKW